MLDHKPRMHTRLMSMISHFLSLKYFHKELKKDFPESDTCEPFGTLPQV